MHAYARAIVAGEIVAGRYVKQACERHLNDLANSQLSTLNAQRKPSGLTFRPEKAEAWISFFEDTLFLSPGVPFKLVDFQAFIIGSIFGWYKGDRRRFRTAYGEMGKGNGKTPLAAGIGLGGLVLDNEYKPEIYSAAAAKDQAKICMTDALCMVRASPEISKRVEILTNNISCPAKMGKFEVLSSEDKGQHGKRVHMALLDEIHAHASAAIVDVVDAGTKNCRNSLTLLITNSGSDRRGPCWAYHTRSIEMLAGKPDDELFAYVCTLDPCPKCERKGKKAPDPKCPHCDDWRDMEVLKKANPGLGTILDPDYLQRRIALAQRMPSKLNNVLQLNCCLWTESDDGWADMYSWRNVCTDVDQRMKQFLGRRCWLGMDAANRVDITCLAILFEREEGSGTLDHTQLNEAAQEAMKEAMQAARGEVAEDVQAGNISDGTAVARLAAAGYALFLNSYVPQALVDNSSQANYEAYKVWAQQGWLIVTPGAVTDFGRIEEDLKQLAADHNVIRLQADPRELGYLLQRVQSWASFEVVQVSQGPAMISQPMKMFEGLIAAGLIKHDGNPVLDWMLGNVVQKTTRSGGPVKYYYPTRPTESQKIDGVPSALMALDGALRGGETPVGDAFVVALG